MTALPPLPDDDPVMVRRRRIAALVKVGKRVGYTALLVSIVVFFVGLATEFPTWTVDVIVIGLIVSIVVLPAPIVFGYGIRAAEREERGGGSFH
ncbi:MAG: hypothetical protein FJW95_06175 [Actinobacteria bacterium]|nr:hypothetical protein [Actinomycetota bacterium]